MNFYDFIFGWPVSFCDNYCFNFVINKRRPNECYEVKIEKHIIIDYNDRFTCNVFFQKQ